MPDFKDLFASEYVKGFGIPKRNERVEIFNRSQFDNSIGQFTKIFINAFQAIPSFKELVERVKNPG